MNEAEEGLTWDIGNDQRADSSLKCQYGTGNETRSPHIVWVLKPAQLRPRALPRPLPLLWPS